MTARQIFPFCLVQVQSKLFVNPINYMSETNERSHRVRRFAYFYFLNSLVGSNAMKFRERERERERDE